MQFAGNGGINERHSNMGLRTKKYVAANARSNANSIVNMGRRKQTNINEQIPAPTAGANPHISPRETRGGQNKDTVKKPSNIRTTSAAKPNKKEAMLIAGAVVAGVSTHPPNRKV
jgi:hypothetical protein